MKNYRGFEKDFKLKFLVIGVICDSNNPFLIEFMVD